MNVEEFKRLEHNAESGEVESMFKLAKLYRSGQTYTSLSIPKNPEKAKELLRNASDKGHKPSLLLLNSYDEKKSFEKVVLLVGDMLDRLDTRVSRLGEIISSVFAWLIGLTVVGVIVILLLKGVAALPVSVAILIGAVIIAMAVSR